MIRTLAAFVFYVAVLAGCQRETEDKIAEFSGHIFVFNYRLSKANYVVTLRPLGKLPEGGTAMAFYENPRGGEPLVTRQPLYPGMAKIVLESPDLQCVTQGKSYRVKVELADAQGKLRQTLETQVLATIDQSILPAKPMVVGPGYDLNPDVFKPNAEPDLRPASGCPA